MAFRSGRQPVCRSKSKRNGLRNRVLDREHVAERVLEPSRPLVIAADCIDQLHRDAQLLAYPAHATLHDR
jgi:hypothetical protein